MNPFLEKDEQGFNAYASKPAGEGLSLFLEIGIELCGNIEPSTGFLINVVDIDKKVRELIVPVFSKYIREAYGTGKEIELTDISKLLGLSWQKLNNSFSAARLSRLNLKLNPFRKVSIDSEADKMIYFSEKFEFAATHKLWNEDFTEKRNFDVFGKCANTSGHGHNYIIEVTIKAPASENFSIAEFEHIVDKELIELFDHKNLNEDVEFFHTTNPTMENIAVFAWEKLAGKLSAQKLHCVTIWESERTCCSYYGPKPL
ncbi:MAG: 6-pyruvoyl trahydropterin synthase family protein [Planctomycetota bacterium]